MTNPMIRKLLVLAALLLPLLSISSAGADELSDLKVRFKARFAKLEALKQSGAIGDTWQGKLEAVKEGTLKADDAKLVNEENVDRAKLYVLIAKSQKTTPAAVAARNAKREFTTAKSGEWLKFKEGWKQKP